MTATKNVGEKFPAHKSEQSLGFSGYSLIAGKNLDRKFPAHKSKVGILFSNDMWSVWWFTGEHETVAKNMDGKCLGHFKGMTSFY